MRIVIGTVSMAIGVIVFRSARAFGVATRYQRQLGLRRWQGHDYRLLIQSIAEISMRLLGIGIIAIGILVVLSGVLNLRIGTQQ